MMTTTTVAYFAVAFLGLVGLSGVLVVIGRAAAQCPQTAAAATLGTWVVTAGFVALGGGVISLIGAALPVLEGSAFSGLYVATGSILIALGLGFYAAASMLRDILGAARQAAREAVAAEAS